MYNPFAGADPLNTRHWPYLVAILLTPFVMVLCLVTLAWFAALMWIWLVLGLEPEGVEQNRNSRGNSSR